MLSIAFTISIIIVIKMQSYSTLRQPTTDLSSTNDTGTGILSFPQVFPQHPPWYSTRYHKIHHMYHIIHQNVAGFWDLASTYDTFSGIKCYMYHIIQCIKSTYLFFKIYARLRRVLAVEINCWQGECRRFLISPTPDFLL